MPPSADPLPEAGGPATPATATATATAAATPAYSTANFASVYAVLSVFRSVIQTDIQEPEDLAATVQCAEGGAARLKELALRLLAAAAGRKGKGAVAEAQWPRLCSDLAAATVFILRSLQVPEAVADSLDAFVAQSPAVRVDVLYWLSEVALMDNPAIKAAVDQGVGKGRRSGPPPAADKRDQTRLQPFAEIAKQRYWLFGHKTRQLYVESLSQRGRGRLELLAQTPDEFAAVAEELRAQRNHAPKELAERLVGEVVPLVEQQAKRRARVERALERQARAMASVHIYETRTRKRQRVNYNVDEALDEALVDV
ncbi:hypothetical protein H4R18_005445 [Coemansia javaensis]|uniref:Uncharacterized protein n=1 Tax=Coemansia javaensis TaxID=2761396 RepID=A0A9W8H7R0_9FUNG|nr:hypothetical protein H4R18_005445 [Coemansia javaensis]